MDNLKNVSNKIKSVVGLRNARVNTDASGNLNESLLGAPSNDATTSATSRQTRPPPAYSSTGATSVALGRQRSNNERFQEHLRQEEEQIYSEIRARKFLEEEDRKLAQLLQSEGGGRQMNVKVNVPSGSYGGSIIRVAFPDGSSRNVQVPPGLRPGDSFVITTTGSQDGRRDYLRAQVPVGARSGDSFLVELPDGSRTSVVVPEGVVAGDELSVPYVASGGSSQGNSGATSQIRLSDTEVLSQLTQEEKAFIDALPPEVRADAIEEKRASLQRALGESQGSSSVRSEQVKVVQVAVPPGVVAGQEFRVMMPDGRAVMVMVPPGVQPGETIGLPANAGLEEAPAQTTEVPASEEEQKERAAFLAALPPELRDEVLANEQRMKTAAKDAERTAPQPPTQVETSLLDLEYKAPTESSLPPTGSSESSLPPYVSTKPPGEVALALSIQQSIEVNDLLSGASSDGQHKDADVDLLSPLVEAGHSTLTPEKAPAMPLAAAVTTPEPNSLAIGSLSLSANDNGTTEKVESEAKTPLERLREAKLGLEQGRISQEEFHRIKQEVIQGL